MPRSRAERAGAALLLWALQAVVQHGITTEVAEEMPTISCAPFMDALWCALSLPSPSPAHRHHCRSTAAAEERGGGPHTPVRRYCFSSPFHQFPSVYKHGTTDPCTLQYKEASACFAVKMKAPDDQKAYLEDLFPDNRISGAAPMLASTFLIMGTAAGTMLLAAAACCCCCCCRCCCCCCCLLLAAAAAALCRPCPSLSFPTPTSEGDEHGHGETDCTPAVLAAPGQTPELEPFTSLNEGEDYIYEKA